MNIKIKPVDIKEVDEAQTLYQARKTYGNKNQILVCIEELNELACVLAKFPRYEEEAQARHELHDKVVDELADVYIILEHIKSIFDVSNLGVMNRAKKKIDRLERWLTHSGSMQETVDDREVAETSEKGKVDTNYDCSTCIRKDCDKNAKNTLCRVCLSSEAVDGIKPYYKKG